MKEYVFALINNGETTMLVEDEFKDAADAMQWAHYCLGFYRCDSVRVMKAIGTMFGLTLKLSRYTRQNGYGA